MPPIQTDGANETTGNSLDTDEAIDNAFLALLADKDDDASKKKPSETGEKPKEDEEQHDDAEGDTNESEETPDEEGEGEGDETEETEGDEEEDAEGSKEKKFADDDETYVKIKVDDKEHEVSVKDLKRLWGQEAALTRKGQELATERTKVEDANKRNLTAYQVMLKRAEERAAPYKQINWAGLLKDPNVTAEEASAIQAEARRVIDEEQFIKNELDGFMSHLSTQAKEQQANDAKACIKALSTDKTENGEPNPHYIEGWNQKVYDDLRSFAVEQGLNKAIVNQLTDPAAFKLMHMAMQFARGAKKVQTVKVNKAPKKIVKQTTSPVAAKQSASTAPTKKAMTRLRTEQSADAAEEAFLSMLTRGRADD